MDLHSIPLLVRREIEARILAPFVEELSREFGEEAVLAVLRRTIRRIAEAQGRELAQRAGGNSLHHLAQVIAPWQEGGALEIESKHASRHELSFCVTRCAYAEMYRRLGIAHLGPILSCERDAAFIAGFNPKIRFRRTQTLMEGQPFCDFHYTLDEPDEPPASQER